MEFVPDSGSGCGVARRGDRASLLALAAVGAALAKRRRSGARRHTR
ncbi:MAG: hypothetical protein U0326_37605 [Polyangiales bacterium]